MNSVRWRSRLSGRQNERHKENCLSDCREETEVAVYVNMR
jgi:hypothetical protein